MPHLKGPRAQKELGDQKSWRAVLTWTPKMAARTAAVRPTEVGLSLAVCSFVSLALTSGVVSGTRQKLNTFLEEEAREGGAEG